MQTQGNNKTCWLKLAFLPVHQDKWEVRGLKCPFMFFLDLSCLEFICLIPSPHLSIISYENQEEKLESLLLIKTRQNNYRTEWREIIPMTTSQNSQVVCAYLKYLVHSHRKSLDILHLLQRFSNWLWKLIPHLRKS